jgi:hypothetical protein
VNRLPNVTLGKRKHGLDLLAEVAVKYGESSSTYDGSTSLASTSYNHGGGSGSGSGTGLSINPILVESYPQTAQYLRHIIQPGDTRQQMCGRIISHAKTIIGKYFEEGGFERGEWFRKTKPPLSNFHRNLLEGLAGALIYKTNNPRATVQNIMDEFRKHKKGLRATERVIRGLIHKLLDKLLSNLFVGQPRLMWTDDGIRCGT